MFGSANNPSNNCRFLSNVTNAIVVGINYRLGKFCLLKAKNEKDRIL